MKVAISGSSGLVGSALIKKLEACGHEPLRLLRTRSESGGNLYWDPLTGILDAAQLEGVGAVVNLAGDNIAGGRWTDEKKKRLRESRLSSTSLLANTLAGMKNPPAVFISASAIGFYGDRGSEKLDENSPVGQGFLAELCKEWEDATSPAKEAGLRVVNLRIGVVLSKDGGALAKMLPPFMLGAGGPLGSGRQYMSWISLDDLVSIIIETINREDMHGPVNATAPEPVTNAEFTKELAGAIKRPAIFPAPAIALKLVLGEMADEMLLASARVMPKKLEEANFTFAHPTLTKALSEII